LVARVWWCEPRFDAVVDCTRRRGVACNGELGLAEFKFLSFKKKKKG
jgi:hypothetical protein